MPAAHVLPDGLERSYGLHFKAFAPTDTGGPLTRQALVSGQIDVGPAVHTDPGIAARTWWSWPTTGACSRPRTSLRWSTSRRCRYGRPLLDTLDASRHGFPPSTLRPSMRRWRSGRIPARRRRLAARAGAGAGRAGRAMTERRSTTADRPTTGRYRPSRGHAPSGCAASAADGCTSPAAPSAHPEHVGLAARRGPRPHRHARHLRAHAPG